MRRSELIQLDIRDLDVERKRVTVQEGKGGKTWVIPIRAWVASYQRPTTSRLMLETSRIHPI